MSEAVEREIYVLYGSQTGNAESLAVELSEKLNENNMSNKCMKLNDAKKINLKEVASFLIVLVATTGNGDAPENADGWWRSIKLRSAAKDLFEGLNFSVLGLGDTNYDKFCYMGKAIDKRLSELGGKRALELACADEGTGSMEETVEAWKSEVFEIVKTCTSCSGEVATNVTALEGLTIS